MREEASISGIVNTRYQRFFSVPGVLEKLRLLRESIRSTPWQSIARRLCDELWIEDGGASPADNAFTAVFVDGSLNKGVVMDVGIFYAISAAARLVGYAELEGDLQLIDEWDRDPHRIPVARRVGVMQGEIDYLLLCDVGVITNVEHAKKYLDSYMAAMEQRLAALAVVKGVDVIVMDRSLVWLYRRHALAQRWETLVSEYRFTPGEKVIADRIVKELVESVKSEVVDEIRSMEGKKGFKLNCYSLHALAAHCARVPAAVEECARTLAVFTEADVYVDVCMSAKMLIGVTKSSGSVALVRSLGLKDVLINDIGLLNGLIERGLLPPGRSVTFARMGEDELGDLWYFFAVFPSNIPGKGTGSPVLVEFALEDGDPEEKADEVYALLKRCCYDAEGRSHGYPVYLRVVHEDAKIDNAVMGAFYASVGVSPAAGRELVGE